MDMEQRLVKLRRIEFVVELLVILFRQVCRLARPSGICIVDNIVFIQFDFLAIFPLFLLAKGNLYRQELAVFLQQPFNRRILQILLKLAIDMQHNVRSALRLNGVFHRIFGVAGAGPMHSLAVRQVTLAEDFYLIRNHKRTVETQAKMTDNRLGFVLILVDKLLCAGERNLVDKLIHLFGGHTNTVILNGEGLFLLVN